jgi:hypothetical protein
MDEDGDTLSAKSMFAGVDLKGRKSLVAETAARVLRP